MLNQIIKRHPSGGSSGRGLLRPRRSDAPSGRPAARRGRGVGFRAGRAIRRVAPSGDEAPGGARTCRPAGAPQARPTEPEQIRGWWGRVISHAHRRGWTCARAAPIGSRCSPRPMVRSSSAASIARSIRPNAWFRLWRRETSPAADGSESLVGVEFQAQDEWTELVLTHGELPQNHGPAPYQMGGKAAGQVRGWPCSPGAVSMPEATNSVLPGRGMGVLARIPRRNRRVRVFPDSKMGRTTTWFCKSSA
jgi:hypothetical protein